MYAYHLIIPCLASQRSSIRDYRELMGDLRPPPRLPAYFAWVPTQATSSSMISYFTNNWSVAHLWSLHPLRRLHVCTPPWVPFLTSFEVKVYYRFWRKSSIFHKYQLFTKSGVLEIRALTPLFLIILRWRLHFSSSNLQPIMASKCSPYALPDTQFAQ